MDPLTHAVRPLKWRRKRHPLSEEVRSTFRLLSVTLLVLLIGLTGTYLYTNSLKPAKGYELEQLRLDHESLQSDLRKLDRQVIEAQSFLNLSGSEVLRRMQVAESNTFSYIEYSPKVSLKSSEVSLKSSDE